MLYLSGSTSQRTARNSSLRQRLQNSVACHEWKTYRCCSNLARALPCADTTLSRIPLCVKLLFALLVSPFSGLLSFPDFLGLGASISSAFSSSAALLKSTGESERKPSGT